MDSVTVAEELRGNGKDGYYILVTVAPKEGLRIADEVSPEPDKYLQIVITR